VAVNLSMRTLQKLELPATVARLVAFAQGLGRTAWSIRTRAQRCSLHGKVVQRARLNTLCAGAVPRVWSAVCLTYVPRVSLKKRWPRRRLSGKRGRAGETSAFCGAKENSLISPCLLINNRVRRVNVTTPVSAVGVPVSIPGTALAGRGYNKKR